MLLFDIQYMPKSPVLVVLSLFASQWYLVGLECKSDQQIGKTINGARQVHVIGTVNKIFSPRMPNPH